MDFPLSGVGFRLRYVAMACPLIGLTRLLGGDGWLTLTVALCGVAVMSFSYSGVEISADRTEVRHYFRLLGWYMGAWEPLPSVVGVTVKYFSARKKDSRWAGEEEGVNGRLEELVTMLSLKNSAKGIIIDRSPVDSLYAAIEAALRAANDFAVPLNIYLPPHLDYQREAPGPG